jgi:hypothetical protein
MGAMISRSRFAIACSDAIAGIRRVSESEQHAIIGRLTCEHRDAKEKLAALHAEAEYIGNHLVRVADALREKHRFSDSFTTGGTLIELPTRPRLLELSDEINRAIENNARLARLLKEAGFPPQINVCRLYANNSARSHT